MKRVLLCPPINYDIEYEINPWMHVENKVDKSHVQKEYDELKSTYRLLQAEIHEIEQDPALPDMVYTANFGVVDNNRFIPSNYKFAVRKKESEHASAFFQKHFSFEVIKIPADIAFEGQGDLFKSGDQYFFGWGKRSDYAAKKYLEELLGKKIVDFKLVDPYYYHLDTCFAPLSENIVLINPRSFTREGRARIHKNFSTVIETGVRDNQVLCGNLVCLGKHTVIGRGITKGLKNRLNDLGFAIHEVKMDEYRKGGGSVKCLTFEF